MRSPINSAHPCFLCLLFFLRPAGRASKRPGEIRRARKGRGRLRRRGAMAAVVRGVLNGIREKGLSNFLRHARDEGYFKCLLDGNLLQTKIHNISATLVGVDKFGNKYYEKLHDTQYGRHRWVEYAEKGRYNASQVPPEWHGWLHHITDSTGDKLLEQNAKAYIVDHKENFSGEGEELIYHSKGHALNPGQRDWTRYQPWEPKKEEGS